MLHHRWPKIAALPVTALLSKVQTVVSPKLRGFEPVRAEANAFRVHHLGHSVTASCVTRTYRRIRSAAPVRTLSDSIRSVASMECSQHPPAHTYTHLDPISRRWWPKFGAPPVTELRPPVVQHTRTDAIRSVASVRTPSVFCLRRPPLGRAAPAPVRGKEGGPREEYRACTR